MKIRLNDYVDFKMNDKTYRGNVINILDNKLLVKAVINNRFEEVLIEINDVEKIMTHTVVCYIKDNDKYLMLYRNKKKDDLNKGKWIGIGGHIEINESPDMAIIREVKEETNLNLLDYELKGIIYFYNDNYSEIMHLYVSNSFSGEIIECDEGTLKWIKEDEILDLNLWDGDRSFWPLIMGNSPYFEMGLYYKNDKLIKIEKY